MSAPPPPRRSPLLSREHLARLQRARVLDAVAEVVADRGYAEASIADVVAFGGLSRRTFYELFDNKADAFFAAYDTIVARAIRRMEAACLDERADPEERVVAALAELLRLVERHPAWARMCVLEGPAASAVTGDRARHLRAVASWVAEVRDELGLAPEVDPVAHAAMVLGGLHASMVTGAVDREALLKGLLRLTIGRDSPDVGWPPFVDGEPRRAAAVAAALDDPADLGPAIDGIVDAVADHDAITLAAAGASLARALRHEEAIARRIDLLVLRHVVATAARQGPAGVLDAIGFGRPGDGAGLSALRCLYALLERPGASGREIGAAIGMGDAGTSRLVTQLRARGDLRSAGRSGATKRWRLTAGGRSRLVIDDFPLDRDRYGPV